MSKKGFIERAWHSYRAKVIPTSASLVQVQETHQAFYAGAVMLLEGIILASENADKQEGADLKFMQDLERELREWGATFDQKHMGKAKH